MRRRKILKVDISRMGVHESIGFFQTVVNQLDLLPRGESDIEQKLTKQAEALSKAFHELINASGYKAKYQKQTGLSDRKRDQAWRDARRYAKAMTYHPDPEVKRAAQQIYALFLQYGELAYLSQTKEVGTLDSLIGRLHNLGDELLAKAGFIPWLEEMERHALIFMDIVQQKAAERAARPKGLVQQCRQNIARQYASLVEIIELSSLLDPAPTSIFIGKLNVIISEEKTRQKRKKSI